MWWPLQGQRDEFAVVVRRHMTRRILITGGAGFVGSHLARMFLSIGHHVRVLDNLSPQVHGDHHRSSAVPAGDVELIQGDVRDPAAVDAAVSGMDAVVHLAAVVGVGQSMYEISRYTDVNNVGTSVLLEALIRSPVERLVVASSMSVYGEGLCQAPDGSPVADARRRPAQLKAKRWELETELGEVLRPLPTPEVKPPSLASIYALSKYAQEQACLITAAAYRFEAVALRFFNVYGPGQSLSNPYTGALAIFASRILSRKRPLIYEDGNQRRDFVNVQDVAQACRQALDRPEAAGRILNVGSGASHTIMEIACGVAAAMGRADIAPQVTGRFRHGDIRHCFADISVAREVLGYAPRVQLEAGLAEFASWVETQEIGAERSDQAGAELAARGLTL